MIAAGPSPLTTVLRLSWVVRQHVPQLRHASRRSSTGEKDLDCRCRWVRPQVHGDEPLYDHSGPGAIIPATLSRHESRSILHKSPVAQVAQHDADTTGTRMRDGGSCESRGFSLCSCAPARLRRIAGCVTWRVRAFGDLGRLLACLPRLGSPRNPARHSGEIRERRCYRMIVTVRHRDGGSRVLYSSPAVAVCSLGRWRCCQCTLALICAPVDARRPISGGDGALEQRRSALQHVERSAFPRRGRAARVALLFGCRALRQASGAAGECS